MIFTSLVWTNAFVSPSSLQNSRKCWINCLYMCIGNINKWKKKMNLLLFIEIGKTRRRKQKYMWSLFWFTCTHTNIHTHTIQCIVLIYIVPNFNRIYFSFLFFVGAVLLLAPCFATGFHRFFKYRQDCSEDIDDTFLNIFRDKYKTPLKHVALRNCSITDDGMEILLNHDLVSLSLWYCDHITQKSWQTLIKHGQNLEFLELGRYVEMLKYPEPNEKTPIEFTLDLPHIRKLILTGVVLQPAVNFSHLQQLSYLDLTQCIFHNDFTLEAIVNLPNLTTLILFNVWPLEQELPSICQLKSLRKLDISTGYFNTNNYGTFKNPNEVRWIKYKIRESHSFHHQ